MILERFKVPAKDQVRVSEVALRATVTQIFQKLGLSAEDMAVIEARLTLANAVKERRVQAGLTQAQLARRIQSSQARA